MPLTLTIRNASSLPNGSPLSLVLDRRGAMIGRAATTDWCLPDPNLHISSRHCEVRFADNRFELVDHSTNGTFLFGQSARLAAPHVIGQGDVFVVGQYEVVASLDEASAAAAVQVNAAAAQPEWKGWNAFGGQPEAAAPATASAWDAVPAGSAISGSGPMSQNWAPPAAQVAAPAAAPGPSTWDVGPAAPPPVPASDWSSQAAAPSPPAADDIWGKFAESNVVDWARGGFGSPSPAAPAAPVALGIAPTGAGALGLDAAPPSGFAQPPGAAPEPGRSPDFGDHPGSHFATAPMRPGAAAPAVPPPSPPPADPGLATGFAPAAASQPAAAPPTGFAAEPAFSAEAPVAPPQAQPAEVPQAPAAAPTPPPPAQPSQVSGLPHLLSGTGVQPGMLKQAEAETLARAGGLLQRLVAGLVIMLEARARAKSQMGANSTNLELAGNNPLKFARSPEQALAQLLNPAERGFMEADLAIEDAFKDLQAHQMATLKAMQGALRATLERFSPTAIRGRAEKRGILSKILPGARDAALWAAYEKEFGGVALGSDEAFMDMFAKEFRNAYEEISSGRRGR